MVDAAHHQQPDQAVPIPDDAQFLRVAGEVRESGGLIAPVPIHAAQPGDVVVLSDQRVGTYLGAARCSWSVSQGRPASRAFRVLTCR